MHLFFLGSSNRKKVNLYTTIFCLQLDYQTVLHLSSRLGHWKLTGLFCSKEIGAQVNPRYGHYLYFQSLLFQKFAWGNDGYLISFSFVSLCNFLVFVSDP